MIPHGSGQLPRRGFGKLFPTFATRAVCQPRAAALALMLSTVRCKYHDITLAAFGVALREDWNGCGAAPNMPFDVFGQDSLAALLTEVRFSIMQVANRWWRC
eukprot:5506279-Pyramimonas_sp.AAC.1